MQNMDLIDQSQLLVSHNLKNPDKYKTKLLPTENVLEDTLESQPTHAETEEVAVVPKRPSIPVSWKQWQQVGLHYSP
jgi:hypothetical protein